jgi:hypothetical protein
MRHLAAISIGAALLVAVSSGPQTSADTVTSAATPAATPAAVGAHVVTVAHHKPLPRCSNTRKQKSRKGRCVGVGTGTYAGSGITYGTVPGSVISPGPTPRIVTFGNGAGSGITTFGHSLGANPNAGTGPFGHLGGTTVGQ